MADDGHIKTAARWMLAAGKDYHQLRLKLGHQIGPLPQGVTQAAEDAMMVVLHAQVQAAVIDPLMSRLHALEARTDWPAQFFVPTESTGNLKYGELRSYESFADFYQREVEYTWGRWADLQATYSKYKRGDITSDDAVDRIKRSAEEMHIRDQQDQQNASRQGQRTDLVDNQNHDVNEVGRPDGNSVEAALRRLRDQRTDLHERVLAGELTAHAAMIEAGFRKPRKRDPMPGLSKLRRAWKRASADEREAFLREVT
jgi:hypothetical protein